LFIHYNIGVDELATSQTAFHSEFPRPLKQHLNIKRHLNNDKILQPERHLPAQLHNRE
jgi:hypothetical protein